MLLQPLPLALCSQRLDTRAETQLTGRGYQQLPLATPLQRTNGASNRCVNLEFARHRQPFFIFGGERGIGYRAGIEFEANYRLILDTPGEGLIRTASGPF